MIPRKNTRSSFHFPISIDKRKEEKRRINFPPQEYFFPISFFFIRAFLSFFYVVLKVFALLNLSINARVLATRKFSNWLATSEVNVTTCKSA